MYKPKTNSENSPLTPAKKPFVVPSQRLADAISEEWKTGKKFSPSAMPYTSLVYTAIDRIEDQKENIIESLMIYVDTDTLSYRSDSSSKIIERQKKEWKPVLDWASKEFGAIWQTVTGIEHAAQTPEMHKAIEGYLSSLCAIKLSAACVLASSYSSVILALAVLKNHLNSGQAFDISRLEEEVQAEQWGKDIEAEQRVSRVKAEIEGISRFLRLLDEA